MLHKLLSATQIYGAYKRILLEFKASTDAPVPYSFIFGRKNKNIHAIVYAGGTHTHTESIACHVLMSALVI